MGERLKALKSDAVVDILPGRDHGTVLDGRLGAKIDMEMHETLKKNGIVLKPIETLKPEETSKKKAAE